MELLIPGLLLVALMAWASTRLKRNAAAAYELEEIETPTFSLIKPAGYLHVLNDTSGLAFRGYSKDFGKVGDKEVKQVILEGEVHQNSSMAEVKKRSMEKAEPGAEVSDFIYDGQKASRIDSTRIVDGGEYRVFQKLFTRGKAVFEIRAVALAEQLDAHAENIETLLDSVRVK